LSIKGYIYAIASGVFFGIIPIIILFASSTGGISSSFFIMMRMIVAAVMLIPAAITRLQKAPVSAKFFKKMLVASALMSFTSILLYLSYDFIPTGIGITLHYTYPLIIMTVSAVFFKMKFNRSTIFAMAISLIGVVLLCDHSVLDSKAPIGLALALCSSFSFSCYLLWSERNYLGKADPIIFTTTLTAFNSVFLLIYNLIVGIQKFELTFYLSIILLMTGIVAFLAVFTQIMAIAHVGSVNTSILGTLEPIICTIGSALVLHERLTVRTIIGSVLVLIAVIIVTLKTPLPDSSNKIRKA